MELCYEGSVINTELGCEGSLRTIQSCAMKADF